jgi:hypothetical protein
LRRGRRLRQRRPRRNAQRLPASAPARPPPTVSAAGWRPRLPWRSSIQGCWTWLASPCHGRCSHHRHPLRGRGPRGRRQHPAAARSSRPRCRQCPPQHPTCWQRPQQRQLLRRTVASPAQSQACSSRSQRMAAMQQLARSAALAGQRCRARP